VVAVLYGGPKSAEHRNRGCVKNECITPYSIAVEPISEGIFVNCHIVAEYYMTFHAKGYKQCTHTHSHTIHDAIMRHK